MFVSNHVLAGGLIGATLRRPASAFALGVASHLAMDALPHWGEDEDADRWLRAARRDGLTALALLAGLAGAAPPARRRCVIAGALGAVTPDLRAPVRHFFGADPFAGSRFDRLHDRLQDGKEFPENARIEAVVAAGLGAALVVVLRRLRSGRGAAVRRHRGAR